MVVHSSHGWVSRPQGSIGIEISNCSLFLTYIHIYAYEIPVSLYLAMQDGDYGSCLLSCGSKVPYNSIPSIL